MGFIQHQWSQTWVVRLDLCGWNCVLWLYVFACMPWEKLLNHIMLQWHSLQTMERNLIKIPIKMCRKLFWSWKIYLWVCWRWNFPAKLQTDNKERMWKDLKGLLQGQITVWLCILYFVLGEWQSLLWRPWLGVRETKEYLCFNVALLFFCNGYISGFSWEIYGGEKRAEAPSLLPTRSAWCLCIFTSHLQNTDPVPHSWTLPGLCCEAQGY